MAGGRSVSGNSEAPRSRRGNQSDQVNTYWSGIAPSGGAFIVQYLVVAGGGSSGASGTSYYSGGGGGAGGLRTSRLGATSGRNTSAEDRIIFQKGSSVLITVGAGGTNASFSPTNGSNSVFGSITSLGGGRGGEGVNPATYQGAAGGSGGGQGSGNATVGGAGTAAQGWGGYGVITTYSGGGGAASNSGGAEGSARQYGGTGLGNDITGSTLGYAGGGGGANNTPSGGVDTSSYGGGGRGGQGRDDYGVAGTINTGGGGGGPNSYGSGRHCSGGGSGIVIIRYPASAGTLSIIGAGLTFTTAIVGTERIYSFTSGTDSIRF
jgi:hypothetical protein